MIAIENKIEEVLFRTEEIEQSYNFEDLVNVYLDEINEHRPDLIQIIDILTNFDEFLFANFNTHYKKIIENEISLKKIITHINNLIVNIEKSHIYEGLKSLVNDLRLGVSNITEHLTDAQNRIELENNKLHLK